MKNFKLLLAFALTLFATSCAQTKEETSNNSNRPKHPYFIELAEAPRLYSPLSRGDFNTTLTNFIKKEYPNSTVHGIANQLDAGSIYLIAVNLSSPTKSEIIHVAARLFVSLDGDFYWKIEPFAHNIESEMKWIKQVEVGDQKTKDDE